MSFIRVAKTGDIPPGACRALRAGIRRIVVWNVAGTFYAMEDACRHMKAPLSTGRLAGNTITCSWHGWKYDVTTGECHDKEWGAVRTFPVKIQDGELFVSDEENPRPDAGDASDDTEDFPTPVFRER